jgi:hypothetical protein
MPQLHESGSPSTAAEFGQPLGLPSNTYQEGHADGYAAAIRDSMARMFHNHETGAADRHLYDGPLGTDGEPMVGLPAAVKAEAEAVPDEVLPLEWKLPANPRRAEKLANRRSHGDRRSLPRRETPPRVLRWLVDDGSEEIDDFWMDVRLRSDERAASASLESSLIDQGDSLGTEFEDAYAEGDDLGVSVYDRFELDYDSFEEDRARIREEIDAVFDDHERAEAEAADDIELSSLDEVAEFNAAEGGEPEAARSTKSLFCDPESFAEYKRFKASQGNSGVGLWQAGSGSSQGISAGRWAA